MVITKNLTLKFGAKTIFENINMHIKDSQITGIIGPSGIGKSSLFLCINQMIRYEKNYSLGGEILYKKDGKYINLSQISEDDFAPLRKEIVYASQHPTFLPFSVWQNLEFFAKIHKIANYKDKIEAVLRQVFLFDEIKDRLNLDANLLSGGQQQRLVLARALLLEPKVLLLDEPTASLNEELSKKVENMLKNLNVTIAIISHFKEQINSLANNIYELNKLHQD